jgi:hypothetical protein
MEGSKRQGTRVGLDYLRTASGLSRNPEHFWPKNGIKVEVLQTEARWTALTMHGQFCPEPCTRNTSAIKSEGDALEMQHSRSQPGDEAESSTNYSEPACEIDQEREPRDDGR